MIACLFLGVVTAQAQHKVISFFDEVGSARIQTEEFSKAHDTIVMVDHRLDDVIWSRFVYRIIDMRYKQNYQLYFPTRADDPDYRNLFLVIRDAVIDGMPIYPAGINSIKPDFKQEVPFTKEQISKDVFRIQTNKEKLENTEDDNDLKNSRVTLINYDSLRNEMKVQNAPFVNVVKNQLKYLIQEIVFFDKHTSRLHTKIMAIAPLHPAKLEGAPSATDSTKIMDALRESIVCWIPFDGLRPYLAMQYMIPNRNETKRVTYDEFFQKRLFTSYIVGEGNMYNRWIPDYKLNDIEGIRKEQDRIATELLNFEQDLWEY
jgi:gliding motility associated protien GldN